MFSSRSGFAGVNPHRLAAAVALVIGLTMGLGGCSQTGDQPSAGPTASQIGQCGSLLASVSPNQIGKPEIVAVRAGAQYSDPGGFTFIPIAIERTGDKTHADIAVSTKPIPDNIIVLKLCEPTEVEGFGLVTLVDADFSNTSKAPGGGPRGVFLVERLKG